MADLSNKLILTIPTGNNEQAIFEIADNIEIFSAVDINTIKELWNEFITKGDADSWYHFISAELSGETVGFACYGKRPLTVGTYDLYWLAVKRKERNAGIGSVLINRVESIVKESKGHLLVVETSGKQEYFNTQEFYKKKGYLLEARIRDFYEMGDDLCIFTKHFSR